MIVFRKTMEAAVDAERQRSVSERTAFYKQYGEALHRAAALQVEMSAWVMNKAENITPEQMAQMFYAQDDGWQAAFFNVMQAQVMAHHEAQPPARAGECRFGPGVPPGEGQWFHMGDKLDESGFETLEAMFDHAKYHRKRK